MAKSKWTVSIDPGLRACGVALWEGSVLFRAWYSRNPEKTERGPHAWVRMAEAVERDWLRRVGRRSVLIDTLVFEVPQVYGRGGARGPRRVNPDDLMQLVGVAGAVAGLIPAHKRVGYFPRQWKGQVPKEVHSDRILAALEAIEREAIESPAASYLHNVVDAVGIGLNHLGRRA